MNSLPSIAQSGLNAALLRLGAAAHNIANAQTPGHERQFVQQEQQAGGGVAVSLGRLPGDSENLAEDVVQQRLAAYAFKANLQVIKTHDRMLGSLVDLQA